MKHPCVIRCIKLAKDSQIVESGRHTWREKHVPNAIEALRHLNEDLRPVSNSKDLLAAVKKRMEVATVPTKARIPCLEYMISANHLAFKSNGGTVDDEAYIADAMAWVEKRHGADNIVAANIQRDEKAIHLVVYVVPLVEEAAKKVNRSIIAGRDSNGKLLREVRQVDKPARISLSASSFVDGPAKLAQLQTDFAKQVGAKHGLERGVERSLAKHTTIKAWYGAINKPFNHGVIQAKDLEPKVLQKAGLMKSAILETPDQVAQRLTSMMQRFYEPIVLAAKTAKIDRQRAADMAATQRAEQQRYGALLAAFDALPSHDLKSEIMESMQRITEAAKEAMAERKAETEKLLQLVSSNMQQGLQLKAKEAYAKAEQLLDDADPDFQMWLDWTPDPEPEEEEVGLLRLAKEMQVPHRNDGLSPRLD